MGWNTAFEELTELPLDEAGNVPVLLPFARKKRLQMFGHNLVEHGLLGLPGTIRLSPIELAGTLKGSRLRHEPPAFAGGVPSAGSSDETVS
jgi:hypothetical protein